MRAFVKSQREKGLTENVGCKILFLQPYSPNLNPIEEFWLAVKYAVKKVLINFWSNMNSDIDFVFQHSGKPFLG
jgi:transposase